MGLVKANVAFEWSGQQVHVGDVIDDSHVLYQTFPSRFDTASSGGSSTTPTAVKTSTYSAAAGDLVPCDTTGGAFTVTLPTAPADKATIVVSVVAGRDMLTIACGGSDVFNKTSGLTSILLSSDQSVTLQYKATGAIWYVLGTAAHGPAIILPQASYASGLQAWPLANLALFHRFSLSVGKVYRYINTAVGAASGNIQVGVVRLSGSGLLSYTRVMDSGVIAAVNGSPKQFDLGATYLPAGDYAFFMWADNTTVTMLWGNASTAASSSRLVTHVASLATGVQASASVAAWNQDRILGVALEADPT